MTDKQTDRQTDKQTDRQTDRQKDKQTHRQTDIHPLIEKWKYKIMHITDSPPPIRRPPAGLPARSPSQLVGCPADRPAAYPAVNQSVHPSARLSACGPPTNVQQAVATPAPPRHLTK